jgi:hypothetical protein
LSLQLDEAYQTPAARSKLALWRDRSDADDWKPVWILDPQSKPWPIFVRIGGKDKHGEAGIKDAQYNEVLDWDPDFDPKKLSRDPQVIVNAPPIHSPGFFDKPNVKLF